MRVFVVRRQRRVLLEGAISAVCILLATSLIFSGSTFAAEQKGVSPLHYQSDTINIFPSTVSALGWENEAAALSQDVSSDAIYGAFTRGNSAHIDRSYDADGGANEIHTATSEPAASHAGTEESAIPVETGSEEGTTSSETGPEEDVGANEAVLETETSDASDDAAEASAAGQGQDATQEDAPATDAPEEIPEEAPEAPAEEAPAAEESNADAPAGEPVASAVIKLARTMYSLAVGVFTTEDAATSDPAAEDDTLAPEETPANTEEIEEAPKDDTATGEPAGDAVPAEDTATEEPAPEEDAEQPAENAAAEKEEPTAPHTERKLIFDDFSAPELERGTSIDTVQLRLSLGARYDARAKEHAPIEIVYKTDTMTSVVGEISLDEEVSNAVNGGYFLFALPQVSNLRDLQHASVEIRYGGEIDGLDDIYVDAAWLQVGTAHLDKTQFLKWLFGDLDHHFVDADPEIYTLLTDEKDFTREEVPRFSLQYHSQRNIVTRFFRGLFSKRLVEVDDIAFVHKEIGAVDVAPEISVTDTGILNIQLDEQDKETMPPGEYEVSLTVDEGGAEYTDTFAFQWGLLSINPDQTSYTLGDTAHFSMGALSANGNTLCDADLSLFISDPQDVLTKVPVEHSGLCNGNNIVDVPDYAAAYTPSATGTYEMYLVRTEDDGSVAAHTMDTFKVDESRPFDLLRHGPSRIYPRSSYPMELTIEAHTAVDGVLTETVPSSFVIGTTSASIKQNGPVTLLSFDVSLQPGESQTFSYEFDAPDISPYLYSLGPASLAPREEETEADVAGADDEAVEEEPTFEETAILEDEDAPEEPEEEEIIPETDAASESVGSATPQELMVGTESVPLGEETDTVSDGAAAAEEEMPDETETLPQQDAEAAIEDASAQDVDRSSASDTEASGTQAQAEETEAPSLIDRVASVLFGSDDAEGTTSENGSEEEDAPGLLDTIIDAVFGSGEDEDEPLSEEASAPEEEPGAPAAEAIVPEGGFTEHRSWQIASDATGSMLLLWTGASIPSGWTCVSCSVSDPFYQRFIVGSSTPNNIGGATTHTHTYSSASVNASASGASATGVGTADAATVAHTHSITPNIGTASNLPAYRQMVVIQNNSAGEPVTIPAGAITIFDATVPAGWTQYNAENGNYVRGESTANFGGTGGSNTHTHTITGTTGAPSATTNAPGFTGTALATQNHTHTINSSTASQNNEPPYIQVILGQLSATSTMPDNAIAMWTDTEPGGWNNVSSASQPFENRFFKPAATYGTTGGSTTHTPANATGIVTSGPSGTVNRTAAGSSDATGAHTHTVSVTGFSAESNFPPYRSAIFAKRAGGAPPAAPTIYALFDNEKTGTSTPSFIFSARDSVGPSDLEYQFEWDDDIDLDDSPLGSRTSDDESGCSPDCFANTDTPSDTNPFNENERIRFTIPTSLADNTTYYWRVRARKAGLGFGEWSEVHSFTYLSNTQPSEWFQTQGMQFQSGTLSGTATTSNGVTLSLSSTQVPSVASFTSNTALGSATLSLTTPSGVEEGDLLIILVGNDNTTATAQWDNLSFAPSGFTLINEAGGTLSDAHAAAFYRVADGSEGSSIDVPSAAAEDYWGYYIRVVGASSTAPINVTGADYVGGSTATQLVTSLNTTRDNTLAFFLLSADGGDTAPFSVSGSNWSKSDEIEAGTGGANTAGVWGTEAMPTPGATGDVSVGYSSSDSGAGFQFSVNPAPSGTVQSPIIDFGLVPGQPTWGEVAWDSTEPVGTSIRLRVMYAPDGLTCSAFVPDSDLPGNATGFSVADGPIDISGLTAATSSSQQKQTYATDGTDSFIVPDGVTAVTVKVWGAGGAGGEGNGGGSNGGNGGGGGYARGTISVTPGETLDIDVGTGGSANVGTQGGGNGGGYSAVRRNTTYLVVAGGGGGGGAADSGANEAGGDGGAGGGLIGSAGGNGGPGANDSGGGGGGTQSAGGAGGNLAGGTNGTAGGSLAGGNGGALGTGGAPGTGNAGDASASGNGGAGGGGGGFFGGGGGENGATGGNEGGAGGGGGSSGFDASVTNTITSGGSGANAANTGDADYVGNAGDGGAGDNAANGASAGSDGLVVVTWNTVDYGYSRLCLQASLSSYSGSLPSLDEWGIRWVKSSQFTQSAYRWFANTNGILPTDPYPVGVDDLGENEPIEQEQSVRFGDVLRLRLAAEVSNADAAHDRYAFKLQYATTTEICDASLAWSDVGAAGSGTVWRGYDNSSVSDGAEVSSTTLSVATVFGTYEEENASALAPNDMAIGDAGEWDWVIQHNGPDSTYPYCFRMVRSSGAPLTGYSIYPLLYANASPRDFALSRPFDNEKIASTTPVFEFSAADGEGEDITYQIQIDNDHDFSSTVVDRNSASDATMFENLTTPADKDPFSDGEVIRFNNTASFSNGTTYYWRVRGKDPSGSNTWGAWSTPYSFTVDTSVTVSTWFQTTEEQFDTNTLVNVDSVASDQMQLLAGHATGTVYSDPIEFDEGSNGTAWGSFAFADTETSSDVKYTIQYLDGDTWNDIPDSVLSGNTAGFDASPVSLLAVDKSVYPVIRIEADLTNSGASPSIQSWSVAWDYLIETPSIAAPFANEKVGTTTPTFIFSTTDPQSDDLQYELQWSTNSDFTSPTTRTSGVNSGFTDQDNAADTSPFASGDAVSFKLQPSDALTNGTTYWWRLRARDPLGSNVYSFYTTPRSFTVDTSVTVSTWFQTTQSQFDSDALSGTYTTGGNVTVATTTTGSIIVYAEGNVTTPRYRTWNGSAWSAEASALSVGAAIDWVVTKASPTESEYVTAALSSDGDVNAQVFRNGSWGHLQELTTTISDINMRGFDVAYEQSSGDALVVYCDGDDDPSYSVWNGSSWQNGGNIGLSAANTCGWVRLISDPVSDEIIAITRDVDGDQYEARVWDGSSWGNSTTWGSMTETGHEGIAAEYEESGNQAVVAVSNGNASSFTWRAWNGSSWSGAATVALGDDFEWGKIARDKGSDAMALCYVDQDSDLGVVRWTGAAWTGQTELDTNANGKNDRPIDCVFEEGGSRDGNIMAVYSDTTNVRYRFWNGATWSAEASISTLQDASTVQVNRTLGNILQVAAYDDVNDRYDYSGWNGTSWSALQTLETNASVGAAPFKEPFMIAPKNPSVAGTVVGDPMLNFFEGSGPYWKQLSWSDTEPGASSILYQIEYYDGDSWELVPDSLIPGNSTGASTGPLDLSSMLPAATYSLIRPVANLTCLAGDCPVLSDWTITWSAGLTVSGTAQDYDQTTNLTSGTVAVAVNGTLQTGKTGTVSGGTWSIANVNAAPGDIVTVFLTGAEDSAEAVDVTVYDGVGDISGLKLYSRHLTIGSDDRATVTNANLGLYDLTNTEDIFYNVNGTNDLSVCASSGCSDAELLILAGNTYQPGSGGDVRTYDVENNGTLELNGNTMRVDGSWDNNATTSMATSTVIFTATTTNTASVAWYDAQWQYRMPITIHSSQVDTDVADFPVYVDLSDLGASFFSNVTSDGGDIRVTAGDGVTELPRELVSINTGGQTGEIYFKADSLSASTDTTFYIYYGNSAANDYATGATYGAQNVWSNGYQAVYHFEQNPAGGAPQYVDSTGNSSGTAVNMESGDRVAGIAGSAAAVDGVDESIQTNFNQNMLSSTWSIFLNDNGAQAACDGVMFSRGTGVNGLDAGACTDPTRLGYHWENLAATAWNWAGGPVYPTSQWYMASLVISPTQATAYTHTTGGVNSGTNVQTHTTSTIDNLDFGWDSFGTARSFSGIMDEARLSNVSRSADWLDAEYRNLSDASSFYAADAEESYASSTASSPYTLDDADGVLDFYNVTFGESSSAATWEIEDTLDVEKALSINQGTLDRVSQPILISGNLLIGANGLLSGIGTTTFDGATAATWTDNSSGLQNIGRVLIDGTSKVVTLGNDAKAESLTIGSNDTFDLSPSSRDITVYGDWINNNTFNSRSGDVNFAATSPGTIITAGGDAFYNMNFIGAGGSWSFTESTLGINHDLVISAGTVTMPTATTTISGSFNSTGGTFAHNNAAVSFTGSGSKTIATDGGPFTNAFYDLRFSGSGTWTFTENNATTSHNLAITQGTVHMPQDRMAIGGSFLNSGGTFVHHDGTLDFTSAGAETIDTNAAFGSLRFTGAGSWTFTDASASADGDLTVDAGSLTLPSGTFTIGGSLANSATLAHNNGTVLFNSTDTGETVSLGASPLYNMTFNSASGGWTISADATSTNNTTLTAGTFTLASGEQLSVGGIFTNTLGGASTTWSGSTLSLESGDYSINSKTDSGDAYGTLALGPSANIAMWNSSAAAYDVDASGSLYSQDHNGVDGDLYIFGSYVRSSGTENWSYATDFDGAALGTGRQANVRFADNASASFIGATLSIAGSPLASTTIDRQTTGSYGVSLSGSSIDASYYDFAHLNPLGLSLADATSITSLAHGHFTFNALFGASLTISTSTIDANPGLQIFDVRFDNAGAISNTPGGSGEDTFLFFDDFDDGSIDPAKWTKDEELGSLTEAGGYLRAGNGITSGNYGHVSLGSETGFDQFGNNAVIWRARNAASGIGEVSFRGDFGSNTGYKARFDQRSGEGQSFLEQPYSGWTFSNGTGTCTADADVPAADTWYTYQVTANSTNFKLYRDGTQKRDCTDATYAAPGEISLQNHYGDHTDYDWVAVRPFVDPEPTHGAWGTQEEPFGGIYRKSHTINGTTAGAQSDYVLPITVNAGSGTDSGQSMYCDSHCETDFSDVRFYDSNGSPLDFWREESYTAGVSAVFWVKVASIPASPSSTDIYMYYGDLDAYNVSVPGSVEAASYIWFRQHSGDFDGEDFDSDPGIGAGDVRWDDSPIALTISGTVYADDGATPLTGGTCDGASTPVTVVVNGGASYSGSCSPVDGSYSIAGVNVIGDPVLTVYLNGASGGERAVTVTKTPTTDIADLDLYAHRVITRHQDIAPMSIADMALYDSTDDPDVPYTAATGTVDALVTYPDTELFLWASTTFTPGGTVTLKGGGTGTSYDGSLVLGDGATFTGEGTTTYAIGGSLTLRSGAAFIPASSTVLMEATTSGKTINVAAGETASFNILRFTGAGGGWNLNGDIEATGDIEAAAGIVTGTGNIRLSNGSFYGNGLVSLGAGTTTIEKSNTLGGTQGWTFHDLQLGNGTATGTTTPGSAATTTIGGRLTIATGHFLDAGSGVFDLAGSGTVFAEDGTFLEGTSKVRYSGAGANILSTGYYDLDLNAGAGTPTYTATGLGIFVAHDLSVGGDAPTIATFAANDPSLDVDGSVRIRPNGTLVGSDSAVFTVGGTWSDLGTFTSSGGTTTFDGTGTVTIAAGGSPFGNVAIAGAGNFTISDHATTTGAFTLGAAGSFTLASGKTLAVGGTFRNEIGGAATTWTGSTLKLMSGTNYLANEKTVSDAYGALVVDADTDVRMWNSSASSYAVDASGSLYSQDHAGADGELYIYGNYPGNGGTDHWSYAVDFDGTTLGGGSRQAQVRFENGARMTLLSGVLSVKGTPSASTTLENQGSGTYGLMIGGTASTTWSYFDIENADDNGLTFSGSPHVTDLSHGDFEIAQNGASGITVGGSAITANPAKTFTHNSFSTTTGVTGYNVTATGTTVSSWRFTNNGGTIAGEAFDNDPDGDPGYIVWDDSAASITISGRVYSDEGSTISGICDGTTPNIHVRVAGLTSYTASCNASTGLYSVSGVTFSPGDPVVAYIDGETQKAATVTRDPISNIGDMDLYENRVIVRHENTTPLSIADMALWDSSDDADIPFTAIDGAPDTLVLPSNRKLIVWTDKEFAPAGNMTLSGGGGGAAYDGTLEVYQNGTLTFAGSQQHSIGGSFILDAGASFFAAQSSTTFTTTGAGRSITLNGSALYDAVFNGSGSWSITDPTLSLHTLEIEDGDLTLPSGTTTVSGSWNTTGGGSFDINGSPVVFTATSTGQIIRANGSDFGQMRFEGDGGGWDMTDTDATSTASVTIERGSLTLPSGSFAIGGSFRNEGGSFTHNTSDLIFFSDAAATLLASSSDLYATRFIGSGPYTMEDGSLSVLDDVTVAGGLLTLATGTLAIGGSFDASAGTFANASGTILFNSTDTGEIIDPGSSPFYSVVIANAAGGWTLAADATTTHNFTLQNAASFAQTGGTTLYVGGVFSNSVGGSATSWNGTVSLGAGTGYSINAKSTGDAYNALTIGANTDIRMWNSSAATTNVAASGSLYSQDHAAVNGALRIYGDLHISTTTEYWSYATDFDGTPLTGTERPVTVSIAANATTTVDGGSLQIVGAVGNSTTITNQGSGTYAFSVSSGTFNGLYYAFRNLDGNGLSFSGTPVITSLSQGDFELAVGGGSLITLDAATLNANASKVITGNRFATTSAITGVNITLVGSTTNAWTFVSHTGNLAGEDFDLDGADACGSIRWNDSSCLLTQQTHYRFRNDDGLAGVPDSEWYNASWTARQRVRLENPDSSTYDEPVVKLTVPYDPDMQVDFEDLRFTDESGTTSIPYWIERFTASDHADVWVKVPSLAGEDISTVFMYFDNPSATSQSSSAQTFIAADDFDDGNKTEYSGDTGLFTVDGTFAYGGADGLDATGHESDKATDGIARFDQNVSQGEIIRYLQYVDTGAGNGDEVCTLFGVQAPVTAHQNYAVCLEQFGTDRISLVKNAQNTDTSGTVLASSTVSYQTGWYEVEIDWLNSDDINVRLLKDGSLVTTVSANDGTYTQGGIGFTFWFQNGGWDSYTSRPHVDTEPTAYFGLKQGRGGASWAASEDTPAFYTVGDIARVRFALENSGLQITDQNYQLEYAERGSAPSCEAVLSSAYAAVPPQSSCGSSPLCMQSSAYYGDGDASSDLLFGTRGAFTSGKMVEDPSNTADTLTLGQDTYTELEYALTPTASVDEPAYCLRVSDSGSPVDTYLSVAELDLRFDPTLSGVTLNGGADITLNPGSTTTVTLTGVASDLNGYTDLALASSTMYRSGAGAACDPDTNNCYISGAPQCSFSSCAGNSCEVSCSADVYYYADPTDMSPYEGEEWLGFLEVADSQGGIGIGSAPGVEMLSLRALDVSSAIDYGALPVASSTGTYNPTTTIQNLGNSPIDIEVEGTDLTDGAESTIPASEQIFATSTFDYASCVYCTSVPTTTPSVFEVDLSKPTSSSTPVTDTLYWGIAIPYGVASNPHHGTNIFYAVGD